MRIETDNWGMSGFISEAKLRPELRALLQKGNYVRAVSPRLRKLLYIVLALLALLVANSAYLASITALEWATSRTYQNFFYQYMFLAGWPRVIAHPRLPQIRTCGITAYGSSSNSFASRAAHRMDCDRTREWITTQEMNVPTPRPAAPTLPSHQPFAPDVLHFLAETGQRCAVPRDAVVGVVST